VNTPSLVSSSPPPSPQATGRAVWDRVWRHHPSDSRDDALLARERNGLRWAAIVSRIESAFGRIAGLRTIELGSGRGDLSILLAERGARVTLLDENPAALAQAQYRFDRLGLAGGYEQDDFLGPRKAHADRFDVAVSSGVIEHFQGADRTRAIAAHACALRAGGMAIISVPNAWCIPYRVWKKYLELRGWWPYGMERPYAHGELLRRSREAGLTEADVLGIGFWQFMRKHWAFSPRARRPHAETKISRLDKLFGASLVLFARKAVFR